MQAESVVSSQTAIYLHASLKVLGAEIAAVGPRCHSQGTADSGCIAELERRMADVLLCDEILGDRPTFEITALSENLEDTPFSLGFRGLERQG
jgi:hypothetical protein